MAGDQVGGAHPLTAVSDNLWRRATRSLDIATAILGLSPDDAASRAYYAAFHAVTALFALNEKSFSKHSAVEAAVHRNLIKSGVWPAEYGRHYSRLYQLRIKGDYGGGFHVSPADAEEAVGLARNIPQQVHKTNPKDFPMPGTEDQQV